MIRKPHNNRRKAAALPLLVICLFFLIGMMALAIDIGMIAVARNQCQNAADAAAMAGARTINGDSSNNYNYSSIPGNAIKAAVANKVFAQTITGDPKSITTVNAYTYKSGQVTVTVGAYTYIYNDNNPSAEGFQLQFPGTAAINPYNAVKANITFTGNLAFARIFGSSTFNTSAQAVAMHRPRDVMIIMDLSGSMRFQSLPGVPMSGANANPAANAARTQSLNPDPDFPQFGHYSAVATAALQGTKTLIATDGSAVDPCNISVSSNGGPPICADFYSYPVGGTAAAGNIAFSPAKSAFATAPGGDNYLVKFGTSTSPPTYGATVTDITNNGGNVYTFQGYQKTGPYVGYAGPATTDYAGYTQGPSYWGKTFFMWPPDPRGSGSITQSTYCSADPTVAANWANNGSKDWRQRFFFKVNTSNAKLGWLDHNTILFDGSGHLNNPNTSTTVKENNASVTYTWRPNYAAIFQWLFNDPSNTNPFPSTLVGGRIRYYSKLPDPSDTALNTRFWNADITGNAGQLSNPDERIWKDYVDFVLGIQGTGPGTWTRTNGAPFISALIGNGDYYQWNSFQIRQKPYPGGSTALYQKATLTADYSAGYAGNISITITNPDDVPLPGDTCQVSTDSTTWYTVKSATLVSGTTYNLTLTSALVSKTQKSTNSQVSFWGYMDYNDNPYRPRHQFWFGPMSFVDWLGNYNLYTLLSNSWSHHWWPGNVHEAHCWACKAGIQTAIQDIKNNHPNDYVSLAFFSSPLTSNTDTSGFHNRTKVPMGQSYQQLMDSLWFPPTTVTGGVSEISPYDPDMQQVPRANGGTAPGMAFMLAYNQFSSSVALRQYAQPQPNYRGDAGGLGRKGARRMIIFETDGFPNSGATASFQSKGSDSYYPVRIYNPANFGDSKNIEWPAAPGYQDSDVFAIIQQICAQTTASPPGYSTPSNPAQVYCIGYGSIFDPTNASAGQTAAINFLQSVQYYGNNNATLSTPLPNYQYVYGTPAQRIADMQQAFTNIMQSGVQVSLIQ